MAEKIARSVKDRKGIVGGSDIGTILGVNKFATPYEFYLSYTGRADLLPQPSEEAEDRMYFGNEMEDAIARRWAEKMSKLTGEVWKVRKSNKAYVNKEHKWLICHPDRIVVGLKEGGKRIGVEVKNIGAFNADWDDNLEDGIPYQYLCQCMDYFICDVCDIVYLVKCQNNKITWFRIEPDEEMQEAIVTEVSEFIEKVESGWIPPASTLAEAKKLYFDPTEKEFFVEDDETGEELQKLYEEFSAVKAQERALKVKKEDVQTRIITQLQLNDCDTVYKWEKDEKTGKTKKKKLFSYKAQTSKRLDTTRLKEERPDIYDQYAVESTTTVLR